ncbi:aromatic hydrocarbon degradation protein [Viscerimonas tarda]
MKKRKLAVIVAALNASLAFAGGLLTNTNQSVHFLRNPARDASTEIDAVYTNPAALVKLGDGFHFSITNQSAFQTRTINSTFAPFQASGLSETKEFEGKASVPVIPSAMGVYRVGDWAISGSFAIAGGGGKATFDRGLPSFDAQIRAVPAGLNANGIPTSQYSVNQYMEGSSIIFGAQLGGTYKINELFSAYAGFRLNIVNNGYKGHLKDVRVNPTHPLLNPTGNSMLATDFFNGAADLAQGTAGQLDPLIAAGAGSYTLGQLVAAGMLPQATANQLGAGLGLDPSVYNNLSVDAVRGSYITMSGAYRNNAEAVADKYLDCTQSGWGVAPIIGFNFNYQDKLNIGVKYEFKTALNVENKTKRDDTGMFTDGVNTPHDIPAYLSVGASYKILPQLTASVGYHHFFDSDAKMAGDKQKDAGSTNEYLAGVEYQINKLFLVSAGGQITKYGVGDAYQRDLSFSCDSYSIGLGGAANVSPTVRINLGYFWTNYSDYTKEPGGGTTKDVFSRTNKVFGAGVDFSF